MVAREYGVHVAGQDQPAVGLGADAQDQMLAMGLRDCFAIGRHGFDRRSVM